MNRRMSLGEFLACLIGAIEGRTGIGCFDSPENVPSPLYSVELTGTEQADTKTMYVDKYKVWVHCISKPTEPYSNAPVLELVQKLEEALTDEIDVPEGFRLVRQDFEGVQTLKRDETGEGHAVLAFSFSVCYGFRCK